MNIIKRLYTGFAVLLVIMFGITILGLVKIGIADTNLNQWSEQTAVQQRQAINFRGSVHDRAISIRDAVLAGTVTGAEKHQADIVRLNDFYQKYKISLDPIYTGKMMQKVFEMIEEGYFPENSKILCFHTGGLQGIEGANLLLEKQNRNLIR